MDYLVAYENCKEDLSELNSALPTELIPHIKNVPTIKRATKNRCSFLYKILFKLSFLLRRQSNLLQLQS
jgi:hypothetical protein